MRRRKKNRRRSVFKSKRKKYRYYSVSRGGIRL